MNIVSRLKRLRVFETIVRSKRDELRALRSCILKSPSFSDEPKTGNQKNSIENLNLHIIDRTKEIEKEIELLYKERDYLVSMINSLEDPVESVVLRLFYLNGYSWSEIARELNGHCKTFQKIRNSGIKHLDSICSQNILFV